MVDGNRMDTFAFTSYAARGSAPSPTWSALAAIAGNGTDAVNFASRVAGGSAPFTTSAALTTIAVAGNAAAIVLLLAPMLTLVKPISKEGSVGDRTVYPYFLALLNNVAWALYATASGSLAFYYVNLAGVLLQLFYIVFYLWFATGKTHKLALIVLFFAVIGVSVVMTALVYYMVIQQHRWDIRFVAVIASVSGGFMQAVPLFYLVTVMRSRRVDGISLIKAFISLFNASTWTAYSRMVVPVNFYVMAPNLFGIVSALLQIVVYLAVHLTQIYYKTGPNSVKSDANRAGRALQGHSRELVDLPV